MGEAKPRPEQPKFLLPIVSVIAGMFGSMALAFAITGNTAWMLPLWTGLMLGSCTLASVTLALVRSNYVFVPLALFGVLTFITASAGEVAFWPGWLLVFPNRIALLLALAAWVAVLAAAIAPAAWQTARRWRTNGGRLPSLGWRKLPKGAMLAIGFVFWAYMTAHVMGSSLANLAWLAGSQPATLELRVVTLDTTVSSGRNSGQRRSYLNTVDALGRGARVPIEAFYRHEVDTIPYDDPAHATAMRGCWNSSFVADDVLVLRGRSGPLGFSIDRVDEVRRGSQTICGGQSSRSPTPIDARGLSSSDETTG